MSRDELIQMARDVMKPGVAFVETKALCWHFTDEELQRLASLIASREREECAKVAEQMRPEGGRAWSPEQHACFEALSSCADAIRERSNP